MERLNFTAEYWQSLTITPQDIEFLQTHLFETETPLTPPELAAVLVTERIRVERAAAAQEKLAAGKGYLPKESYAVGERLVFPALDWKRGVVTAIRAGKNPELGVRKLAEKIQELDAKRKTDREVILKEIEKLGRAITGGTTPKV